MNLRKIPARRTSRLTIFALCLLIPVGFSQAAEANVLWKMDLSEATPESILKFVDQSTKDPVSADAVSLGEEDGIRFLRKTAGSKQSLFRTIIREEAGGDWESYRLKLRFRQMDKGWVAVAFNQALPENRAEQGYLWYYLMISQDSMTLKCHGREIALGGYGDPSFTFPPEVLEDPRYKTVVRFDERGYFPLMVGGWVDGVLSVSDEALKVVLTTEDGESREFELKTYPGRGICRLLISEAATDIASFVVEEVAP